MAMSESPPRSSRQAAIDWLLGRVNFERMLAAPYNQRRFKLDRMRNLLARLDHPEDKLKIVHVAGTKGKGSTSAMIAAILTAAGHRTGVFSSPHLERIEERFAVDGAACSGEELAAVVDRLQPVVAEMDAEAIAAGDPCGVPTFFEATTAVALLHFLERQVDAAVLEVGLGGRLDSTNVCRPLVSVITNISLDHTQQLGNTLAAIAGEKAGIIKPSVPVVCGATDREPQEVIARTAQEQGCRLIQLGRDFRYGYHGGRISFEYMVRGQEQAIDDASLALRGPHQGANAAVALATVAELRQQGWQIPLDAIRRGLATATLPGRVEVLPGEPNVVLDTAHNPASARALIETLREIAPTGRRTLIVAVSGDKDVRAILHELAPHFDRFVATAFLENPRAVPAGELAGLVRAEIGENAERRIDVCATPRDAWDTARRGAEVGQWLCIAGSFYLAAEMRPFVLAR
jgi:dihydrofolate synthase / folylpolyglutamate synthase